MSGFFFKVLGKANGIVEYDRMLLPSSSFYVAVSPISSVCRFGRRYFVKWKCEPQSRLEWN
jgi:hypothetical protein